MKGMEFRCDVRVGFLVDKDGGKGPKRGFVGVVLVRHDGWLYCIGDNDRG